MESATTLAPHHRLARLAGAYAGTETVHDGSGAAAESSGRFRTNLGLGGRFLVMDYQQEQLGTITRLVHAVFGHDPTTDRYTMHWFDDRGEDPGAPAVGGWQADELVFERLTPRGHVRYSFGAPLADGDALTMRLEISQDGVNWAPAVSGSYRRANWDRRTR